MDDYKSAKEAFVSDLSGTTATEVILIFAVMPGTHWLYAEIMFFLEITGIRTLGAEKFNPLLTFLIEFILLILPTTIAFTFTELTLPIVLCVYFFSIVLNYISIKHAKEPIQKYARKDKISRLLNREITILTWFRAQVILSTCLGILAVDFQVFPRRFAKTESYGYSVMDVGVGAFIVSSGLVSKYARQESIPRNPKFANDISFVKRCIKFLKPIAIVVFLGLLRLITIKGSNYQEHVSEYGVHWNFYFTLAGVYVIYSLLQSTGNYYATSPYAAAIILAFYQSYLSQYGGEEYILHAERSTFYSQNREGVLSLAGYISLYIFGVATGQLIFEILNPSGSRIKVVRNCQKLLLSIFGMMLTVVAAAVLCDRLVAKPSRRMMNLTYVLWVLAQAYFLLFINTLIVVVSMRPITPTIFLGGSRNMLFIFLIANIFTGIVNLSMQTIYASNTIGFTVLVLYMLAVTAMGTILEVALARPLMQTLPQILSNCVQLFLIFICKIGTGKYEQFNWNN